MGEDLHQPWAAIIVLNWRKPTETLACLESLAQIDHSSAFIVVVDNGSGDDSVPLIRQRFPELAVLETGENLGYAGGNNAGIRWALEHGADYICILNNDVKVTPGFLAPLRIALDADARAGIATPLIMDFDSESTIWTLGAGLDRKSGNVHRLHAGEAVNQLRVKGPFEVDIAPGSAMMAKRAVFDRVGLLDEAYFLYFEEADWCIAVRQAGYRILAVPESVVTHQVSATLGQASPITDYYMTRNRILFIWRHWSGLDRIKLLGKTMLQQAATIASYTVKPHHGQRLPHRNARLLAMRDGLFGRWGRMDAGTAASVDAKLE